MRKIIDRLIKWLSPPEPPATVQSLVFNVPLTQIAEWTEDTLKEWLRVTGTPADKIQEKALDIRVLGLQAGVSLKEPRRVWNKFTVGKDLSREEVFEQWASISRLLGFNDPSPPSRKYGVCADFEMDSSVDDDLDDDDDAKYTMKLVRVYSAYSDYIYFPVVDDQLDLDEIKAAIAKLLEQTNDHV